MDTSAEFVFEGYDVDHEQRVVTFCYRSGEVTFSPTLTLTPPLSLQECAMGDIEAAVLTLGLAELPHFWKATLAPKIVIEAAALSPQQVAFWEHTWKHALGEFFYTNDIDPHTAFSVSIAPSAPPHPAPSPRTLTAGALVPFGGGKDSFVTGERLKQLGHSFSWFILGRGFPVEETYRASEVEEAVRIERPVESYFADVISLNEKGAKNGHVSITATYMASAVLAAHLKGMRDVVFSIERSASEGNVMLGDFEVNHQYTKSFAFEAAFADYLARYVHPELRLFSLLRDRWELQIVAEFTHYPQYVDVFMSCNKGIRTGCWCGACAKCAFTFMALAAFLPFERVVALFQKNLFDDGALTPLFRDLIGQGEMKPFDCVGTFDENMLALYRCRERYADDHPGMSLPRVLSELDVERGATLAHLLTDTTDEHRIPPEYHTHHGSSV